MNSSNLLNTSNPVSYLKMAAIIFLAWFIGTFLLDVFPYFGMTEAVFGEYWNLIAHITGGLLATIIGPLQF